MRNQEVRDVEEMSMSGSGIEMIRKKVVEEWGFFAYHHQYFNKEESPDWRYPAHFDESTHRRMLENFYKGCVENRSFKFSIEAVTVGGVKLSSYSELLKITDFKTRNFIRKTLSGRLFGGAIVEGSEKRLVIVKTWDVLLPYRRYLAQRLPKFCDEIELFTDTAANMHPNLAKLCTFCCDTRLAAVYEYDEKCTGLLSEVLLDDKFGWSNRIKVAAQLADLLACLHQKGIVVGCVTASCIMIDEEVNIKVFDFGYVSNHVNEDSKIPIEVVVGREAPLRDPGKRTMKSDVYLFGLLLLELITKEEYDSSTFEAKRDKKQLVDECFKEADHTTAITLLTLNCMDFDAEKRPTMKHVSEALKAMTVRGETQKR